VNFLTDINHAKMIIYNFATLNLDTSQTTLVSPAPRCESPEILSRV